LKEYFFKEERNLSNRWRAVRRSDQKCSAKRWTNLKYPFTFPHSPLKLSTKKPAAALSAGIFSP
ncbi:hypothetical protein, partial [Holdemania filiformis]|uniref:hypothetical protein n=1 Tax=Holdemania filiformis TaxID=61171 RepID=UPI003A90B48C